eukprot:CAMPEP_0119014602 /NCGR_PEP_ID=MMETSP1176-20130426/10031_1 /TAXON_ID=265551 /ORGANISM="Synedropsis recta cf, Strain CCMP1620" /LENGTH=366 /DNA_ID=CAMNT_0006967805 /DNA_START=149 /DNA_END=1249 /DNA_ORIENTATION=+
MSTSTSTARSPGNIYQDAFDAVGSTPLLKLKGPSEKSGCTIYGKCEFAECGAGMSVKARAAKWMLLDAEERGLLKPGGTIVEATAGNTGIALAALACARGYKSVIVIPSSQSQEKKDALRHAGAQLVEVPPCPSASPNHYVKIGARLAEELGAHFTGQFDSASNRQAHVESTGPELYEQLDGNIDGFSCAIGTGGTLSGTAQYLREKTDGKVKIGLTDPGGAKLVKWYNEGVFEAEGGSISEGIGQVRVTGAIGDEFKPDYAFQVDDAEAMEICFDLMKNEGISVGMSSGINVAGAMKLAQEIGPGKTIVTILCDSADRYKGKMFDVKFLREKGLPVPDWLVDPELSVEVASAVKRATVEVEPKAN